MTNLFVFDNDERRYWPDPNESDDDLRDTSNIEEKIGYLRKIDIGDAYLIGEQNHVALRFRAIPNIKGLPTRDQEHFGYWILDEEAGDSDYTEIPKRLKTLFESEKWEYPDENTEGQKETSVTNPRHLIEIWERQLGMLDTDSVFDENRMMEIESRAETLRSLEVKDGKSLTLGVPSFEEAIELLIEMRDSPLTIVVGDLNRADEVVALDPDIILKYDEEYQYLEQLDSSTEQKLSDVVSDQVTNSITNSLDTVRADSDGWKIEIATINKILSTIQTQGAHHKPVRKARNLDPGDFPKPAQSIASDLKKLHETYEFDRHQNNLKRSFIPTFIYDPQSPYDELADKLENRLEYIETEIYNRETEAIVSADRITTSINYIADQLGADQSEVRDRLFDNSVDRLEENIYGTVKEEDPQLYERIFNDPRYLIPIVMFLNLVWFILGIFVGDIYSISALLSLL